MFSKNQSPITTIQTTTKGIEHGTFNLRVCIATHLIWWPFHECKAARNIKELDNSGRSEFKKKIKHKYIFKSRTLLKFWRSIQKLKKKKKHPNKIWSRGFFFFETLEQKNENPEQFFKMWTFFVCKYFMKMHAFFNTPKKIKKQTLLKKQKNEYEIFFKREYILKLQNKIWNTIFLCEYFLKQIFLNPE